MSVEITQAQPNVEIIFYVKEGNDSPYQGRLVYTQDDYSKLMPADIEAAQMVQFAAWKAATLAAQQANEEVP